MRSFKNLFVIKFDEGTKATKLDGALALIYTLYIMIFITLLGLLFYKTTFIDQFAIGSPLSKFILYIPISFFLILPIFVILRLRKQPIKTVGITFNHLGKSLLVGFIGSLPIILIVIIGLLNQTKHFQYNLVDTFWLFLYFFICIGFVEEISYRGFIQTRILGLISNKWVGIILVGVLFGLTHVPFQMIKYDMTFFEFLFFDGYHLIYTMFTHIYLVYIYTRTNNVLSSTVTHTFVNFIPTIIG